MSQNVVNQNTSPFISYSLPSFCNKKNILIAISAIFFLGMVASYVFAAPWVVTFAFFALSLTPLLKLGLAVNEQREKIIH